MHFIRRLLLRLGGRCSFASKSNPVGHVHFRWSAFQSLFLSALFLSASFFGGSVSWGKLGIDFQMALGNPTEATTDPLSRTNYLLARSQYALSFNDSTHQANWACWSYSTSDIGADVARTDAFAADTDLPIGYLRISSDTFGGDWDRGHVCPSEDRVFSIDDNKMTFRMSNMMPQASANNRGPWSNFEAYCRSMASDGSEVLIMAGPSEFTGATISNGMAIPGSVWKIAVKVPNAASTATAASRVSTSCRVIAIIIPNTSTGLGAWTDYICTVEDVERVTGFNFFTAVEASTAVYLKNVQDTGTGPNSPTVVTAFSPASGTPGTTVTIQGYNFGVSPSVSINGVPATVLSSSGTVITATVNNTSAGVGPVSVAGPGGTDTSYADFTVFSGTEPGLSLSTFTLNGFSSTEGKPGASKSYTVSGSNLTGAVTVTAPANFEISLDNNTFGGAVTLNPSGGTLSSIPVYVRIKSAATMGSVSGTITHVGGGATNQSLTVGGTVASGAPSVTLSASSLSGFFSLQGKVSASRSYLVSGVNLSNAISVAASSTNYEVSLNNSSFSRTLSLSPSNEALSGVPIYVRLSTNAPPGTNSGTISHSGAGITPASVSLLGSVNSNNYLLAWNFNGTNSPASMAPSSKDPLLDGVLDLGRGPGASVSSATNSFRTQDFGNDGISVTNTDYFQFSLSATNGKLLSLSQITARLNGTGSFATNNNFAGASNQFAFSTNGTQFSLIGSPSIVTAAPSSGSDIAVDLSGVSALQNLNASTTVTFRFYASGQTTTGGWGFFSGTSSTVGLAVDGTITQAPPSITSSLSASGTARAAFNYLITADNNPVLFSATGLPDGLILDTASGLISGAPLVGGVFPVSISASNEGGQVTATLTLTVVDPVINISKASLSNFSSLTGSPGSSQTYTVSGTNLTGSISVVPPTGYEISTNNSAFVSSLTLSPVSGSIASQTIYVRLNAAAPLGANNGTVIHSGGGALTQNLSVSGTVYQPTLSPSVASISGLNTVSGTVSASKNYSLSGSNLTGAITLVASNNFEISTDNITFSTSLMLLPAGGSLNAVPIYVRVGVFAPVGTLSGSIVQSGGGAADQTVNVSASVTAPPASLTLSVATLSNLVSVFGSPGTSQSYSLSGYGLTNGVTLTASTNFEVSLNNSTFASSLSFSPAGGSLTNYPVYVRLNASAPLGSVTGSVVHTASGAAATNLTLSGTVNEAPPTITSPLSGSIYTNKTFSYTITATNGTNPINGYGASGLPSWLRFTNGTISGTNNNSLGTNVTFQISATSAKGTSTASYQLRVLTQAEQDAIPLNVVINKYLNSTSSDKVELLVVGDSTGDLPVDMRGMILKDFGNSMADDTGGRCTFKDQPLWASVKAGTLVVLSAGNTATEDLDPSDFVLRVNLGNSSYFTASGGTFDIANTDMILLKTAGTGSDGVAGGIHGLAAGTSSTQYSNYTGKKMRSSKALSSGNGYYSYALNANSQLADFYASNGASTTSTALTFGAGHSTSNTAYITSLRNKDQDGPVITLNGSNPMSVALGGGYTEPGATASDAKDGSRPVSISGSVNPLVAGTYIITYSSTDLSSNTRTVTRTVNVADLTPPSVTLSGTASVQIVVGGTWSDPGAMASDAVDGGVAVVKTGSVNSAVLGTYILTYTAADLAGNVGSVTRTVNVVLNNSNSMTSDSDNNGMADLVEYALGGAATGNSPSILPTPTLVGTNLRISYLARTNDSNLVIRPVVSTNLSDSNGWNTNGVVKIAGVATNNGFERQTWETPMGAGARKFLRLNISR